MNRLGFGIFVGLFYSLYISFFLINPVAAATLKHFPDGINMSEGYVSGWSCSVGNSSPTTIKIYASNFSSSQCKNFREGVSGCLVGSTTANIQSEVGVTSACGTPNHRFRYNFPDSIKDGKVHRIFLESTLGGDTLEFGYYAGMTRDYYYYNKDLEKFVLQDTTLTPISNLDPYGPSGVIQNCTGTNNRQTV